jgi:hypothetical protein
VCWLSQLLKTYHKTVPSGTFNYCAGLEINVSSLERILSQDVESNAFSPSDRWGERAFGRISSPQGTLGRLRTLSLIDEGVGKRGPVRFAPRGSTNARQTAFPFLWVKSMKIAALSLNKVSPATD